jgi:hypothetical protein
LKDLQSQRKYYQDQLDAAATEDEKAAFAEQLAEIEGSLVGANAANKEAAAQAKKFEAEKAAAAKAAKELADKAKKAAAKAAQASKGQLADLNAKVKVESDKAAKLQAQIDAIYQKIEERPGCQIEDTAADFADTAGGVDGTFAANPTTDRNGGASAGGRERPTTDPLAADGFTSDPFATDPFADPFADKKTKPTTNGKPTSGEKPAAGEKPTTGKKTNYW